MRIKKISIVFFLALAAGLMACLAACSGEARLEKPQSLRIEDEALRWDAVENAEGYIVEADGKQYETQSNAFSVFTIAIYSREYEFRVQAYGELRGAYDNSEWSETLTYIPQIAEEWGFRLTQDGSGYEVSAVDAEQIKGKLVIPSSYNGIPFTRILPQGFMGCKNLTGVLIADSVKSIGTEAFAECRSLVRVGCPRTAEIGNYAFANCVSLRHILLPQNIETLPQSVLNGCSSLSELDLPEGLRTISHYALGFCPSLKEVRVPSTVTEISPLFVSGSTGIESLTVAEGNTIYRSENNCVIRIEDDELVAGCCESIIPESVKLIGEYAFAYCKDLTEIVIPGNIKSVGKAAFTECEDLRAVIIEDGVEKLGEADSDYGIFCNAGVESIKISASVNYIAGGLTATCKSLKSLKVDEANPTYRSEGNCIIGRGDTGDVLVAGCAASVIPQGVTQIGNYAFYGIPVTEIQIAEGAETIGEYAFAQSSLSSAEFPSTLKTIGFGAFRKCGNLTSVVFPDGLEEIGACAFDQCGMAYRFIAIPKSVKIIGSSAFDNCIGLTVILPASVEKVGAEAFREAVIYTDSPKEVPAGWYRGEPGLPGIGDNSKWQMYCNVVYDCAFGYDDGVPYVKTFTLKKEEDGVHPSNVMLGAIGGQIIAPRRAGYIFKGWALEENGEIVCGVEDRIQTVVSGGKYSLQVTLQLKFLTEIKHGTVLYAVWEKE